MQQPKVILDILNKKAKNNFQFDKLYKYLYNPEWYIESYINIFGKEPDNYMLRRIDKFINDIRYERYSWCAENICYVANSTKLKKSLVDDRIVTNTLYRILNAIYDQSFSDHSHWARDNYSCTSALTDFVQHARGAMWFIDIQLDSFYNNLDVNKLFNILRKRIRDGRILEILRKMLKAHSINKTLQFDKTFSEAPIGLDISMLLCNIYLNEIDQFIENSFIQKYNYGDKRSASRVYNRNKSTIQRVEQRISKLSNKNDKKTLLDQIRQLRKVQRTLNSKAPIASDNFRRCSFVRYADRTIIFFIGTKCEATNIAQSLSAFIQDELVLKARINVLAAKTEEVRFCGYNFIVQSSNCKISLNNARYVNGVIVLRMPRDVMLSIIRKFSKGNKSKAVMHLVNLPVHTIIEKYQVEFRSIAQYYKFVTNQSFLSYVKYVMETSLMKTLSAKLRTSCSKLYSKYSAKILVNGFLYKVIQYNSKIYFGAIPLKRKLLNGTEKIHEIKIITI